MVAAGAKMTSSHRIASHIEQRTLENGIQVVVDTSNEAQTVAIEIAARAGSCDEIGVPHGTAHFLEHMVFKGTESRTSDDIHSAITSNGGYLNASTDPDTTLFQCMTLEEDFETAADVLADIIQNAILTQESVDLEKKVIREEMRGGGGGRAVLFECLLYAAYGDQDLSRPVIGLEDSIQEITPSILREFRDNYYSSDNLIVSVAGPVSIDRVCEVVGEKFRNAPRGSRQPMQAFEYFGGEQGFACTCERGVVKYGYEMPHPSHESAMAATLFRNSVGFGPTSRLIRELREKRGLVYSAEADDLVACNEALMIFETEGHVSKIKDIFLLMDEVINDTAETLTEAELSTAKRQWLTWDRMQRDSMQSRCQSNMFDMIACGSSRDPNFVYGKLQNLTVHDVKAAAKQVLSGTPSLAIHGPARGMPKLAQLPKRDYLRAA
jgi:predicted Zn-dependent peptidase